MSEHEARFCRLEESLGRHEACPEALCAFWRPGAEPRQDHCLLDGLDLRGRRDLAQWLHALRSELEDGKGDPARADFYRRLNEGRSD